MTTKELSGDGSGETEVKGVGVEEIEGTGLEVKVSPEDGEVVE